jgi:hypothetical protein
MMGYSGFPRPQRPGFRTTIEEWPNIRFNETREQN